MTDERCAGVVIPALLVLVFIVWNVSSPAASAAPQPCDAIDEAMIGRLLGPTGSPLNTIVGNLPTCRVVIGTTLMLEVSDTQGGEEEFDRQLALHPRAATERVDDYVDGAFFGWGSGTSLDFVVRRAHETAILRLSGTDSRSGFDGANPQASAPDGDVSGSMMGSGLWAVTTSVLSKSAGPGAAATADDLSGLWRTADVTPCAPQTSVGVRVSRFTSDGDSLRSIKVAGDSCLDNRQSDFAGTVSGGHGAGIAFGGTGTSGTTTGTPYQLTVVSPTVVQLTGQAGTLRYELEYQRLSWPALSPPSAVSTLLGIPSPSEALTAKNVGLAALLSAILFGVVVFPTTLFNKTLEANLDRYRDQLQRLRRRLDRKASTEPASVETAGSTTPSSIWQRPAGAAIYLGGAGVLFSLMQPGWGLNLATLITLIGFIGSLLVASSIGIITSRVYLSFRYKKGAGRTFIEASTLGIAGVCVAASRVVGFVPGYLYGVFVGWKSEHPTNEFDRGRIVAFGSALTLVTAITSWFLIPALQSFAGKETDSLKAIPLAIAAGVFVGAVHTLTIGLIPLHFLPGKTLRDHAGRTWVALWASGGFLFVLVLLRPGLVSGNSGSIIGTCALAAALSALAIAFWGYNRPRLSSPHEQPGETV